MYEETFEKNVLFYKNRRNNKRYKNIRKKEDRFPKECCLLGKDYLMERKRRRMRCMDSVEKKRGMNQNIENQSDIQ